MIVGSSRFIGKTTDGGLNWVSLLSGTFMFLPAISFTDINNGIVVGGYGTILKTTKGGATWISISRGVTMFGVSFSDANNGTAVGVSGKILRTINGGVTFIGEENINEDPMNFFLLQNYPNPFNPTTTINYSILKTSFIVIKIYDALGKEIATLVNGEKSAGNYTVMFNANGLSSGIYFYQIKSDGFLKTKKMILLR